MALSSDTAMENNSNAIIFESVFSLMIESFAPNVFQVIIDFEQKNPIIQSSAEGDRILEDIFHQFPRDIQLYSTTIEQLSALSSSCPDLILKYLCKIIKKILKGERDTPFEVLLGISTNFDMNNRHHILLFHYFSLLCLTDIICQIVANRNELDSEACLAVTRTGSKIALEEHLLPGVWLKLVNQWSVIYSLISKISFFSLSTIFTFLNQSDCFSLSLSLIKYARFDSENSTGQIFFAEVLDIFQRQIRKRNITGPMLESLGYLIITLPFSENILQKLLSIANGFKHDKSLSIYSYFLYTSVGIRYPKIWERCEKLLLKKILPKASDKKKLKIVLRIFRFVMYGRDIDPSWLFWEWGVNKYSSPLSYIKCNGSLQLGQSEQLNFFSLFLTYFYPKADFSVCQESFRDILVHLASLDFNLFMMKIVPNFVDLPCNDPRFLSFIMSISLINSDDFKKNSFKIYTNHQINAFNNLIKPRAISILALYEGRNQKHGICNQDKDLFFVSLSEEADQKLYNLFSDWELNCFGGLMVKHNVCEQDKNRFLLIENLLPSLRFVFSDEDFKNPYILQLLIELSYHQNSKIATPAYKLLKDVVAKLPNVSQYLIILCNIIKTDIDAETLFVILSLIYETLSQTKEKIDENIAYEIEYVAFLGLSSIYPDTRNLAYTILQKIYFIIGNNSVYRTINSKLQLIERNVKTKVLLYKIPNQPEIFTIPSNCIQLETGIATHFYDIWIFFLAEIMNVLIEINYLPLLSRIEKMKSTIVEMLFNESNNRSPSDIGLLLILLSSQHSLLFRRQRSSFDKTNSNNEQCFSRSFVTNLLSKILQSENARIVRMGFSVLPHVHVTLFPLIISILSKVSNDKLTEASMTLVLMLRSPELDKHFFKGNLRKIISFMSIMQYHFITSKLNGSRNIQWDQESENKLIREISLLRNYCILVSTSFKWFNKPISEDVFSLSLREMVFRFLLNWSMTKSTMLASLRGYASDGLHTITKLGIYFNDSLLFDYKTITFFGTLELSNGMLMLSNLLKFHLDILLEKFIIACYTQPRSIADRYFEAIISCTQEKNSAIIYSLSGQMLMLILVYTIREHPHSHLLLNNFFNVVEANNNRFKAVQYKEILSQTQLSALPNIFAFAIEAVFSTFFDLLKIKNLHIPIKDIIESVRPWTTVIRLLPKQTICSQEVISLFHYFTPYQFLNNLMDATEKIDDDQIRTIASLWVFLVQSPDHTDIVPLFIFNCPNIETKQKLFGILLDAYPEKITAMISNRFSFAFYFHVTKCLKQNFLSELWIAPLLVEVFTNNWNVLLQLVPPVIHFAFLFRNIQLVTPLFNVFCKKLNVECPEGELSLEMIRNVSDHFKRKLNEISPDFIFSWGNEALKWIIGSSDLKLSTISFVIYNRIQTPNEPNIINCILRTIYYFLKSEVSQDESKLLCDLVTESFIFFDRVFDNNEILVFDYISSFLDCKLFVEDSLRYSFILFKKFLNFPELLARTLQNSISIIRPLIPILETDTSAQAIVDDIIKGTKSEEIMMIIAPIKMNQPQLFASCQDVSQLLSHASDSSLCKSLVHYSMMIKYCSRTVVNYIFEISSFIVSKIVNENNRSSLSKIYQKALQFISTSSKAGDFIRILSRREPNVAIFGSLDVYEWDRPIDNVARGVKMLLTPDDSYPIAATDCISYTTVSRFLNSDSLPKILPFSTQSEIINGMINVENAHKSRNRVLPKRKNLNFGNRNKISKERSDDLIPKLDYEFTPLIHPSQLVLQQELEIKPKTKRRLNFSMDIQSHKRKRSSIKF